MLAYGVEKPALSEAEGSHGGLGGKGEALPPPPYPAATHFSENVPIPAFLDPLLLLYPQENVQLSVHNF